MSDPNGITSLNRFQAEKARRLQERTKNASRAAASQPKPAVVSIKTPLSIASAPQPATLPTTSTRVEYDAWDVLKMFPKTVPVYATVGQVRDNSYKQLLSSNSTLIDPRFLPSIDTLQSPDDPSGFAREDDLERAVGNLWDVLGPQLQSLTQQIGAVGTSSCVSDQVRQLKSDVRELEQQAIQLQQQTSIDVLELARLKYPAPVIVSATAPNPADGLVDIDLRSGLTNEVVRQLRIAITSLQAVAVAHGTEIQITLPTPYASTQHVTRIFRVLPRLLDGTLGSEPIAHTAVATNAGVPEGQLSYHIALSPSDDINVARYEVFSTLRVEQDIPADSTPGSAFSMRIGPVPFGVHDVAVRAQYDGLLSEEAKRSVQSMDPLHNNIE